MSTIEKLRVLKIKLVSCNLLQSYATKKDTQMSMFVLLERSNSKMANEPPSSPSPASSPSSSPSSNTIEVTDLELKKLGFEKF
jgi:hypothetical protein